MKSLYILCITSILMLPQIMRGQDKKNQPPLEESYKNRLLTFKSEKVEKGKIIFLGNSITEGGNWKELLNSQEILNRGIGGDTTYGILDRLSEVTQRKPSKLFLLIGINDIAQGNSNAAILNNHAKIIQRIKKESRHTRIFLFSILPINPSMPHFVHAYDKKETILEINEKLKTLASQENIQYIDLHPIFEDSTGHLKESLTYDGVHLTQDGYKAWARFLTEKSLVP